MRALLLATSVLACCYAERTDGLVEVRALARRVRAQLQQLHSSDDVSAVEELLCQDFQPRASEKPTEPAPTVPTSRAPSHAVNYATWSDVNTYDEALAALKVGRHPLVDPDARAVIKSVLGPQQSSSNAAAASQDKNPAFPSASRSNENEVIAELEAEVLRERRLRLQAQLARNEAEAREQAMEKRLRKALRQKRETRASTVKMRRVGKTGSTRKSNSAYS